MSVMNSRRLMGSSSFEDHHITFGVVWCGSASWQC